MWEPENISKTQGEFSIIAGPLKDIAWDGESKRLIAVGKGKSTFGRCITADTGNTVGQIIGHTMAINATTIRHQRPFRAATVSDDGAMGFYKGVPYELLQTHNLRKGFILATSFSPDGSILATVGSDKKIHLYDGTTGDTVKDIGEGEHTGSIYGISWSQDGKKIATASVDQTVRLWEVDTGSLIQTWKFGEGVSIRDQQLGVVFPHGRTDGLIISINEAGELTYLQEGKEEPVKVLQGHQKSITALHGSSDGKGSALWSASFDGRVCHWDIKTGTASVVDGVPHTNQIVQMAAHAGKIYTAAWDDTVKTVDESAVTYVGKPIKLPAQPKGASASGDVLYVATVESIAAYSNGELLKETPLSYTPTCIAASGNLVAVGGDQHSVKVYTAGSDGSLEELQTLTSTGGTSSALAFSKDGSHLAAGDTLGKIYPYNTKTWEVAANRWSAHTGRVTCIAWDDTGAYAASGSLDTNIFVYCLAKDKQGIRTKAPNAHKDGVTGICWIEGGQLASAGADANIKIWNLENLP